MTRKNETETALKTVDIFSGKTRLEEHEEAVRNALDLDLEESKGQERELISLDTLNARTAIYCSERFESELDGFRLKEAQSVPKPWWYLEKLGYGGSAYAGLIIPEENVAELAVMFTDAARVIKERQA